MKNMNTSVILNMIRCKGEISRIELAKATGLTAATVTNITSWLIDTGIVEECSVGVSTGGRKPVLLRLSAHSYYIASAYISPVSVQLAVADLNSNIIYRAHKAFDTSDISPEDCVSFIADELKGFSSQNPSPIVGLGVGVHGIADSSEGVIINAPILKWKNVPIKQMLKKATGLSVYAENDVRLMAIGEMWFGSANECDDFVLLYVGSGVGSAIISGGRLVRGVSDAAGEIGHSIIDLSGPICECGKRGCLQAHTGEAAMLRILHDNLDKTDILTPDSLCSDIISAYKNHGDKAATAVVENEIKYLSAAVLNITNLFNPALIVVASGFDGFSEVIVPQLASVPSYAITGKDSNCTIAASSLGSDAVLYGGIARVLDALCDNPSKLISK